MQFPKALDTNGNIVPVMLDKHIRALTDVLDPSEPGSLTKIQMELQKQIEYRADTCGVAKFKNGSIAFYPDNTYSAVIWPGGTRVTGTWQNR